MMHKIELAEYTQDRLSVSLFIEVGNAGKKLTGGNSTLLAVVVVNKQRSTAHHYESGASGWWVLAGCGLWGGFGGWAMKLHPHAPQSV
jgi:hypothetical protein